ncbi:molybdate ABC transporter substrate-binding protein [Asanoa iriomotensis]|uniref:Molybdate-binding protein n=1 Tax=Asanoa iriomotensis TaxID=234613 RepID=A0ABQ4CBD5_9ACTN|nr:molybdate ABC transporter substrate-binding protein [Asanoa iriomotensis]GIF60084.1 molybdate-binding protein [Asanoa iriomotensis]
MRARWISIVLAAVTAASLTACGSDSANTANTAPTAGSTSGSGVSGPITVFAAASLTESFTQIGKDFEAANPGTTVTFSFAGSSALATQINQGAPADVFASAAPANMKTVTDAGNADGTPQNFAKNQLVIAVPKGNPKNITSLSGLAQPGVKVALCAPQVPCGAAAQKALQAANVQVTPVTQEQDVKAALSKVTLGEVDAALVYRTDAKAAANDVDAVEFPESASAVNEYPIVVLKNAPNQAGAQAFVNYVLSPAAEQVLTNAGFQKP